MKKILVFALSAASMAPLTLLSARGDDPIQAEFRHAVRLVAETSHPVILSDHPQDVVLLLALEAAELPRTPRPSMNLALVIDRSGSMGSEDKLKHAKSAAEQFIGRLRAEDRLAIVVYDDDIQTLVPSTPVAHRQVFLDAIRGLRSGNSTDLYGGVTAGCEEVLRHLERSRLNRVVLLSDGLATAGITDSEAIRMQAARFRARGIHISTMGMGISYDDLLLRGIASDAGGNYYYVKTAESVGAHLDHELDQMAQVVARELEVRVALSADVESWDIFGHPYRLEGRTLVVPIKDMAGGEKRKVVVRLRVLASAAESETTARLADASLRFLDAATHESHVAGTVPLICRTTESIEEVELARNIKVLIKAEVVHNAEAMLAAMDLQRLGDISAAQELLTSRYRNSKLVNDTEYRSSELTRMLRRIQQILVDLEATANDAQASRELQLDSDLRALGYVK